MKSSAISIIILAVILSLSTLVVLEILNECANSYSNLISPPSDCSKTIDISTSINITELNWTCNSSKDGYMIKFNISSGLVFRLRIFYEEPFDSTSNAYFVKGRWNDVTYCKYYPGLIIELWSQPGQLNISKLPTFGNSDVNINVIYSAYTCNETLLITNDCGKEINNLIAEAPPGLKCTWDLQTSTVRDESWTFGIYRFHTEEFEDSASITLFDLKNGCTIGNFYYFPGDAIRNAVTFNFSTNFIRIRFNSGSLLEDYCNLPNNKCPFHRELTVNYKTIVPQNKCSYINQSTEFCDQRQEINRLEIEKYIETKLNNTVQNYIAPVQKRNTKRPKRLVDNEEELLDLKSCDYCFSVDTTSTSASTPTFLHPSTTSSVPNNTTSAQPTTIARIIATSTTNNSPVMTTSTVAATTTTSPTTTLFSPTTEMHPNFTITLENVYETLVLLNDYLRNIPPSDLNSKIIAEVGLILIDSANVGPVNRTICEAWMEDINLLLAANSTAMREAQANDNTCSELLNALDELSLNAIVNDTLDNTFFFNGTLLSLSVTDNNCTYDIYKNGICQETNNNVFTISQETQPSWNDIEVYLFLPKELVCNETDTRVVFKVFNNLSLFVNETEYNENTNFLTWFTESVFGTDGNSWCNQTKLPEGHVVSGTIIGPDFGTLSQPATVSIRIPDRQFTRQELSCGFWNDVTSNWDSYGCNLGSTKNGLATFESNHLTDFTLLVTTQPTDPGICNNLLNDFGFVTSIISTISLGIVFIMLIFFMYIKRKNPNALNKYFASLCFSGTFFAFFLVFTVASDQTRVKMTLKDCQINAAIMYTLLISVMLWVLSKSLQFYKLYVVVFESNGFLEKITALPVTIFVCVVVPIVVTIGLWFGAPEFFRRNDQFCWIMPELTLYGVVIPMTVLLVINIIVTLLVTKSLFSLTLTRNRSSHVFKPKNSRAIFWRKVWTLFAMQIVLCLPWVMQYFTFINIDLNIFNYFFTIFNGLQGLWIAIIYVYEHRKHLKKLPLVKTKTTIMLTSSSNTEDVFTYHKND